MSKEALKELVHVWANRDASKSEIWLKILAEQDIDDLDILMSLSTEAFTILLYNVKTPVLFQRLSDWYRSTFPDSKAGSIAYYY
jgi:hypothetical protein